MATESTNGALEVTEDDDFVDKRKKQDLLEMRQTVREWQRELFAQVRFGQTEYQTAVTVWGDIVREYLITVEPILLTGDGEMFADRDAFEFNLAGAEAVYLTTELGVVEVPPPDEYADLAREAKTNDALKLLGGTAPESKYRRIAGIKDVIELETVSAEWQIEVYDGRLPKSDRVRKQTVTNEQPLNRVTLKNAVRVVDEWLQNHGIGIRTAEMDDDAGFDYEDILEEGPPGNGDKPEIAEVDVEQ